MRPRRKRRRLLIPRCRILYLSEILAWSDTFHARLGRWPRWNDGKVDGQSGLTWCAVNQALIKGHRGLPPGSSLGQLLREQRGRRHKGMLPPFEFPQILAWADAHHARTDDWPSADSGPIPEAPVETWTAVNAALSTGGRGLPGGSSLAQLLTAERGVRNSQALPPLSVAQVLEWADAHHARTGEWPSSKSGPVQEAPEETWCGLHQSIQSGTRGLAGYGSLALLLARHRDLRHRDLLPERSVEDILIWADAHHARTGGWPGHLSGPIPDSGGETWAAVYTALVQGQRGLPGGYSLARLPADQRGVRNEKRLPPLTEADILATGGYPEKEILAIRADGAGDVTKTHMVWRSGKGVAYVPSPLYHEGYLYVVADGAMVTCFKAATGEPVWQERLQGGFTSSPVLVGDLLHITNEAGKTFVLKTGPKFKVVARNTLEEGVIAQEASRLGNIVAVCDVDTKHAEEASKQFKGAKVYKDFRKLLERKDVDAILNGTPDHWHTLVNLAALKVGKDIYSEKPLTLTIDEGKRLVAAVRESGRILQTGSQQRSDPRFRLVCELVRNGRIGKLTRITTILPAGPHRGPFKPVARPGELDWDFWQGQAPVHEYMPERCHLWFRYWLDYSGGTMTDWGAHHNDIALWAMDLDRSGPATVEGKVLVKPVAGGFTAPAQYEVEYTYANGVRHRCLSTTADTIFGSPERGAKPDALHHGVKFEGSDGWIFVTRGRSEASDPELLTRPLTAPKVRLYASNNHMGNFFDSLRSRKAPVCDAEVGHRSASLCHLGVIALRLGRKLKWDAAKEEFPEDREANGYLAREMRKPWTYDMI